MRIFFRLESGFLRPRRMQAAAFGVLVALAFALGPSATAVGEDAPASGPEQKLNDAQSQLRDLESQLVEQRDRFAELEGQLAALKSEVERGERAYKQFSVQLEERQTQIMQVRSRYTELRTQLDELVRYAYIEGPGNTIAAIFDARSQLDLEQRLDFFGQLSDYLRLLSDEAAALEKDLETQNEQTRELMTQQSEALIDYSASEDQVQAAIDETAVAEEELSQTRIQILDLIVKYRRQIRESDLEHLIGTLQGNGNVNYGDWANAFLQTIGAPTCKDNLVVMVSWQLNEGTSARYNPLATTYDMPGATMFNSIGVKNYRALEDGLKASELTLKKGSSSWGYGPILQGLGGCASAETTAADIAASSWCGCGSGYVTSLISRVRSNYNYYAKL